MRLIRNILEITFSLFILCSISTTTWAVDATDEDYLLDLTLAQTTNANVNDLLSSVTNAESPKELTYKWPIRTFLLAEVLESSGRSRDSMRLYRSLVEEATKHGDSSPHGQTSLSAVALWRWAGHLLDEPDFLTRDGHIFLAHCRKIERLKTTKLLSNLSIHAALPLLREDLYFRILDVARRLGATDEVEYWLDQYVRYATSVELPKFVNELIEQKLESDYFSRDRFDLRRANWLFEMQRYQDASDLIREATKNGDPEVVERSRLLEAYIRRARGDSDQEVLHTLNRLIRIEPDPAVESEARYLRGLIYKKRGNRRSLERDFSYIHTTYPKGDWSDDALMELAREYQMHGDYERALMYFRRVIEFQGPNDWLWTARFQMALTHYLRWRRDKQERDWDEAHDNFVFLQKKHQKGNLNWIPTFWKARLLAESANSDHREKAIEEFQNVVTSSNYEYYGMRAALHLYNMADGTSEISAAGLPLADARLNSRLATAYSESKLLPHTRVAGSPQFKRLWWAIESGLYEKVASVEREFRTRMPGARLQDVRINTLYESDKFAALVLFLSLRIDAVVAKERLATPENLLAVSAVLVRDAKDMALAVSLTTAKEQAVRNHPAYLRTAFPQAYRREILGAVEGDSQLASIIYSIARHESTFDETAISSRSAYGLLQITPERFDELDHQFDLLGGREFKDYRRILLDPTENIRIGVAHFRDDILNKIPKRMSLPIALMIHSAGAQSVSRWIESWKSLGIIDDVELIVETARARETRNFVRSTLAAIAIVNNSGMFGSR